MVFHTFSPQMDAWINKAKTNYMPCRIEEYSMDSVRWGWRPHTPKHHTNEDPEGSRPWESWSACWLNAYDGGLTLYTWYVPAFMPQLPDSSGVWYARFTTHPRSSQVSASRPYFRQTCVKSLIDIWLPFGISIAIEKKFKWKRLFDLPWIIF